MIIGRNFKATRLVFWDGEPAESEVERANISLLLGFGIMVEQRRKMSSFLPGSMM